MDDHLESGGLGIGLRKTISLEEAKALYSGQSYNITHTDFRDLSGRLLWVEPLAEDNRLYSPGEEFIRDETRFRVARIALVDNTQHVNVEVVLEDQNIVEPFL